MSGRARRSARADQDLIEIAAYIAVDSPSAARRVLAKLAAKSDLLAEHPGMGRRDWERPERRIFVVGNYLVIYCETSDGIEVLRYLHGRRDRRGA